jgi:hypothetical protein
MKLNELQNSTRLQVYKGVPNESTPKEKSAWQRFKQWATPWLKDKRDQGERYLAAKVAQDEANAMKTMAETHLIMANARKVTAEASAIEHKLIEDQCAAGKTNYSSQEIAAQRDKIDELLTELRVIYGMQVEIEVNDTAVETKKGVFFSSNADTETNKTVEEAAKAILDAQATDLSIGGDGTLK